MASNTVGGGPSFSEHEQNDPDPPIVRQAVGRDSEPWPHQEDGGDSSTSFTNELTSDDNYSASPQEPAPTTENRSSADQAEESSTVDSTDGPGPTTASQQSGSSSKRKKLPTTTKNVRTPLSDDDEF